MDGLTIRPARVDDRDAMLAMLSRSFSWPSPPSIDFGARDPHLFHDARMADHLLGLDGEDIVGVVGVYGFSLKIDGVRVPGAAIGQVATVPERRRQGIMSRLLAAAFEHMDEQGHALSWLIGERRRYEPHGFALGGATLRFALERTLLPQPPDPSQVRTLWPEEIVERILGQRAELPTTLLIDRAELEHLVAAQRPLAKALGESWLVHDLDATEISFAGGALPEVARLAAHVIQARAEEQVGLVCADAPTLLARLGAAASAQGYQLQPSCLWRITRLAHTLGAAVAIARAKVGPGSDSLALVNADTGEGATISCHQGFVSLAPRARANALELDTRELSQLCFGRGMLDQLVPGLRRDSPLRAVLPLPVHHLPFYRF